jgi:hypothetical protein
MGGIIIGFDIFSNSSGSTPIFSSAVTINGGSIQAPSFVELVAGGNISIANSSLITNGTNGTVFIGSVNGSVTMSSSTLSAGTLDIFAGGSVTVTSDLSHNFQVSNVTVNAGDSIFVDGNNSNPGVGVAQPGSMVMTAVNSLTAQNLKFDFTTANLTAHTINLTNISFSNNTFVTLTSHFGVLAPGANTNQPSVPGDVNFINNVTYNGQPAQNHIVSSGPGIIIAGGAP